MNEERARSGEVFFLGGLLLLLLAVLQQAAKLRGVFQGIPAGAGSLAQLMVVGAILLVITLAIQARRLHRDNIAGAISYLFSRDVVLLLSAVIVYGLVLVHLGFAISTFLFLLGTMFFLDKNNLRQKAIISLGTVLVIVVVFTFLFEVVLP
ncbi:MAG: tripartite tricarboxylate transporter TctB family protein [Firmicutes bacterium]|nr:tripartite tricarboxylate transporter TctB family protein [Dethiobacter sp.]MBS3889802.1 tripartite tricarboxylate transporter TctB family protein [Bacillota bacterium]MBS4055115.1 tripartite tricarboxylate transporter TctB family protein [Thermaerobacter sp.]